ncbi:Y4yA family PLP-dependent enzyme [uncultured Cyclobacterium sp.]|uniref:Y4yA family PLP-dependent enzyme n=1 Tax=uncultured Cyclobacterium sp. TaxID=453820 RepID=UPI0030EC2152|tara:strand:- start:953 stop:2407 length:1455 start_codon:yes stop_codon:yes gene_type:complete
MKPNYTKGNPEGGLTAITSNWMHGIFKDQKIIGELIEKHGSPINLHHLPSFSDNIITFKNLFESYGLRHQLYYARKANKSKSLVKQALSDGIGVDTASLRELEQSISLGGNGRNLVLTSAIKTKEQYALAIQTQVPIILDNWDECEQAQRIAAEMNQQAIVGIRTSGFNVEGTKLYSRFGFDIAAVEDFVLAYFGENKLFKNLNLQGFHFHLDGYSTLQRGKALSDCIRLSGRLNANDYQIDFIDMGGGILMNYLESETQWKAFDQALQEGVKANENPLTFNGHGLGYEMINNELSGKLKTYPFFNTTNGPAFLKEVLDFKDSESGDVNAHRLKALNLEIRIEPGRSLLNQVGMTLAKVAHRKQDAKGQWLVGLEMNMSQMMSSSEDFLLDPYVIYVDEAKKSGPVEVFFTGAYCLERDVLLKRKISLPQLPAIGDFVAFVNTAGYMMHFFETEAHLFELSQNLSFSSKEDLSASEFVEDDLIG